MASRHWHDSAEAWVAFVDSADLNRSHVLDPAMLRLAGDVRGLRALDVGCGEGRFCRLLADRGAQVVGLDPTSALLERAWERGGGAEYIEGFAESLPFEDRAFDLVVSYVAMLDVPDYRAAVAEMSRVLRSGGRVLYANLNAFTTTAVSGWMKGQDGENLCIPVDNYSFEWGAVVSWRGIEIVNYHRPMADMMQGFLSNGLVLRSFEEPLPSPEAIAEHPRLAEYLRVRHFVVMEWQKP
jgi:SAM-dependent methyltransferase